MLTIADFSPYGRKVRTALAASPSAERAFEALGRTKQYAVVLEVVTARTVRTRSARVAKAVTALTHASR